MPIAGYGKSRIPFEMLDLAHSAAEAKKLEKMSRIYHRGQDLAWNGREILSELLETHGGIQIPEEKRRALERIFAIIMWGELAAWKISAQLADEILPLEAKMAATAQVHDEARHFYVMHDYLKALGGLPARMDRAPQAMLDLVLGTENLAHKLVGMQLMVETIALTIFQMVRETKVEPVLCELLRYFERDEARHVGLGVQHLPQLMDGMNRWQVASLLTFQSRIAFWTLREAKVLEPDFAVLGIDVREVLDRGRRKQVAVTQEAFQALGIELSKGHNPLLSVIDGVIEYYFPPARSESRRERMAAAWHAMWSDYERVGMGELDVHSGHEIRTAKGVLAKGERVGYD